MMGNVFLGLTLFTTILAHAVEGTQPTKKASEVYAAASVKKLPVNSATTAPIEEVKFVPKQCKVDKSSVHKRAQAVSKEIIKKISTASKGDKKAAALREVTPYFDYQLAAKKVLSRSVYKQLEESHQLESFEKLLINRIIDQYSDSIGKVGKSTKVVLSKRKFTVNRKDNVEIGGKLKVKGKRLKIKYRLSCDKKVGDWKVYDIEIEGVGVLKSYERQISAIIKKRGINYLLKTMSDK